MNFLFILLLFLGGHTVHALEPPIEDFLEDGSAPRDHFVLVRKTIGREPEHRPGVLIFSEGKIFRYYLKENPKKVRKPDFIFAEITKVNRHGITVRSTQSNLVYGESGYRLYWKTQTRQIRLENNDTHEIWEWQPLGGVVSPSQISPQPTVWEDPDDGFHILDFDGQGIDFFEREEAVPLSQNSNQPHFVTWIQKELGSVSLTLEGDQLCDLILK